MSNVMQTIRGYRPSSLRTAPLDAPSEERAHKEMYIRIYQERARLHQPLFEDASADPPHARS